MRDAAALFLLVAFLVIVFMALDAARRRRKLEDRLVADEIEELRKELAALLEDDEDYIDNPISRGLK